MISTITTIAALGLPTRTHNALKMDGVHTVGQVAAFSAQELLRIPGLGMTGLEAIERALRSFGMSLPAHMSKDHASRLAIAERGEFVPLQSDISTTDESWT